MHGGNNDGKHSLFWFWRCSSHHDIMLRNNMIAWKLRPNLRFLCQDGPDVFKCILMFACESGPKPK